MKRSRRYWFNNTSGLWRFQGHYQAVPIKKDLALGFGQDYLAIGGIDAYSLGFAKSYLVKGGVSFNNLGFGGSYEVR